MDSITDICYCWSPNKEGRIREEYIEPLEKEIEKLRAENSSLRAQLTEAMELIEVLKEEVPKEGLEQCSKCIKNSVKE